MFRAARLKLTGMYAISFFLILLLFGIVRFVMFTHYVDAQVDAGISALVSDVVHTPRVGNSTATATASATETPFDPVPAELFYFVLDGETGTPVVNHRNLDPTPFLGLQVTQRAAQGQANWDTLSIDGARYRVLAAPVYTGADIGETVLAVRDLAGRDRQVRATGASFIAGAALAFVAALAAGYYLAGRALRPIVVAYDRQRTFVADASHELRAPITVIRTASDLLLREDLSREQRNSVEEIREVADEASQMVTSLLELARLQGPSSGAVLAADVAEATREECAALAPLLEQHRTSLALELAPGRARVTPVEVRLVVRVLVENVLMHTPAGTPARVSSRLVGRSVQIVVEDGGPGVPDSALDSIFDRFSKGSTARTAGAGEGYGLGLAIVSEIVGRSGGSVRVSVSPLGGLKVTVTLPQT